jgi:TrmH family RNA methyltransferase
VSLNVRRLGARDQRVQRLRRLIRRSSVRDSEHAFVAEGAKLVEAALDAGVSLEAVFVADGWRDFELTRSVVERAAGRAVAVFELGPGIMERVGDTVSPQPVCAVVQSVDVALPELLARLDAEQVPGAASALLVCVDVRDPGNLGAVLRIAGATGMAGVICCAGTVDPFNPKVVRASAGAVFRVPLIVGVPPLEALQALEDAGYRCWATVAHDGRDYSLADLGGRVALVLGNEGVGLGAEVVSRLDGALTIPMEDGTESLNVAMTVAVLCFEIVRRRRSAG